MVMRALGIGALLLVCGCATRSIRAPAQVPHDPQATRTWWIEKDADGNEYVVMCDTALLAPRQTLCIRWP